VLIVGIDDLVLGGSLLVVGCAANQTCSQAVTNAASAILKICIPDAGYPGAEINSQAM
jgi:hypothetical protein